MPARKPTALKLLHGDFEKNPQRRNKREPIPKPGTPTIPKSLTGEAKKEWQLVTKELRSMRVLTKIDRAALQCYCELWGLRAAALQHVQENGICIERTLADGSQKLVRNPYDQAFMEYSRACLKYQTEFRLTAGSRGRLRIDESIETRSELERIYLS